VERDVRIRRDEMGVPHISASKRSDVYVGLGYAMGTDRLWQLDWLRRCAVGRTAEIVGEAGLQRDIESRVLGLGRAASVSLASADGETRQLIDGFVSGINLAMRACSNDLPPEFLALRYSPEPWTAEDTVAIWKSWAWYLSGRLYWIAEHDYILRELPEHLARALLQPSGDRASIVEGQRRSDPIASGDGDGDAGSNNWVVSGRLASTGHPFLASDPHVVLWTPSIWYEARLSTPEEETAGICHAGVPGFLIGRNRNVAWGFTNNICSIRDLYRERVEPDHPDEYLGDGDRWRAFEHRSEAVRVGSRSQTVLVKETERGPVVNDLIDARVRPAEPVSLVWTGTKPSDEIGVMLNCHLAANIADVATALSAWVSPTFNFVFADEKQIAYQCAGSIPVRGRRWLGIRDASSAADRWSSLRTTPALPAIVDPERGWIVTANNRVSWSDDTTNVSGFWPSSLRAERIGRLISASPADTNSMKVAQLDMLSPRAERVVPTLRALLGAGSLSAVATNALAALGEWDLQCSTDAVGPTIFEMFMLRWTERVVRERVAEDHVKSVAGHAHGLAENLIVSGDEAGWFVHNESEKVARDVFEASIAELAARLGRDVNRWTWGRMHVVRMQHPLDDVTSETWPFNISPEAIGGSWNTINNAPYDPGLPFVVHLGVSHRIIADLSSTSLLAANSTGASGNPLSEHYRDAFDEWIAGRYHELFAEKEPECARLDQFETLVPA
jgi:penicillin amidase